MRGVMASTLVWDMYRGEHVCVGGGWVTGELEDVPVVECSQNTCHCVAATRTSGGVRKVDVSTYSAGHSVNLLERHSSTEQGVRHYLWYCCLVSHPGHSITVQRPRPSSVQCADEFARISGLVDASAIAVLHVLQFGGSETSE
jgi:hypothetical protein